MTTLMAQYSSIEKTKDAINTVARDYTPENESYFEMLDKWAAEMSKIQNVMGMHDYFGGF